MSLWPTSGETPSDFARSCSASLDNAVCKGDNANMTLASGFRLRRRYQAAISLVGIWFFIAGVLSAADTWSNAPTPRCALQLPLKWLGCVMAAHENLAGGLIAAGGALLAAWWAGAAVWQQIEDTREQLKTADTQRQKLETISLGRLVQYYSRLLKSFDDAPGADDIKYVHGMNALHKSGNLVPFVGSLPPEHQILAQDCFERLKNLNAVLEEVQRIGMSGTLDIGGRAEVNRSIQAAIEDIRKYQTFAQEPRP